MLPFTRSIFLNKSVQRSIWACCYHDISHIEVTTTTPVAGAKATLAEMRKTFGQEGLSSNIDPSCLWPKEEEFKELLAFSKQFESSSLKELVERTREAEENEIKSSREREEKIVQAMAKMPELIAQLHAKKARKQGEMSKMDEKRQVLLDEAREHFGYDISPRDPRFLELVERKQEEEKRLKKKMRKEKRVERTVLSLTGGQVPELANKTSDDKSTD